MKITSFTPEKNLQANHRKEKIFYKEISVIALKDDELINPVTLRFYGGSTKNACLWIDNLNCNGSGTAKRYDESTAAARAIKSAGIELSEDIHGRGEAHIKEAIKALATHLGYKQFYIHIAHA